MAELAPKTDGWPRIPATAGLTPPGSPELTAGHERVPTVSRACDNICHNVTKFASISHASTLGSFVTAVGFWRWRRRSRTTLMDPAEMDPGRFRRRSCGQHHAPLVRPLGEASRRAEPEPASGRASKLWLPTARVVDIGYCGYSELFLVSLDGPMIGQ